MVIRKENLEGINPILKDICISAIGKCPFDVVVVEGLRSQERQDYLFSIHRTKTHNSKHIDGKAVDLVPENTLWKDELALVVIAYYMREEGKRRGVRIRSGVDWKMDGSLNKGDGQFWDAAHHEIA
jgi:hypothetical protein